jgi:hypothetical protein
MRGVCQGVRARSRRGRGIRWMMLIEKWHWWKPLQYSENRMISDGLDEAFRGEDQKRNMYGSLYECKTKEGRQYLAFRYHRASAPKAVYRIPSSQQHFSWLFRETQSFLALVMN